MQTIQQFTSWFANQKISGKLAVGCTGLVIFFCLCSVSTFSLRQPPQAFKIENTLENAPLIVDVTKILGAPARQVESVLGSPTNTGAEAATGEQDEIDKAEGYPDGGNYEYRIYPVGNYLIEVDFDKQGIAKRLEVIGLAEDHYSLDQWDIILARMGLDFVGPPNMVGPDTRAWSNVDGYAIKIRLGPFANTFRVYKIP